MKKSKFLLLGSVASLASIPFVAAKCGETKEEEKKKSEGDKKPGGDKNPGENKTPGGNTDPGKNPGEEMNPGNNMTPGSNSENGNNQNTPIKKSLSAIISSSNQQLGEIEKNNEQSILEALLAKNRTLNLDKSQLDVKDIKDASAIVFAKEGSTKYEGQILVSFTVKSSRSENLAEKKPLPALISIQNQQLDKINKKDKDSILNALLSKNKSLNLDKSQLDVKDIKDASAIVFAKEGSTKYEGQILVSFTVKSSRSENLAEKKPLPALISIQNQQLDKINKKDKDSILNALLSKNKSLNLDKSQLDVKDIKDASAIVFAKEGSTKYEGQILVSFTLKVK